MQIQFIGLEKYDIEKLFKDVQTPCYILDEAAFIKNGEILKSLQEETGAKVLLAEKAFSNFTVFPLLSQYLAGTEASGLFEARLGHEEMPGKEVHVFSAAYGDKDFKEVLKYTDHIIFNSVYQLKKYGPMAKAAGKEIGLRINPECSTQEGHAIYDPCSPGSRLGVTREIFDLEMDPDTLSLLSGLHSHTLCEQDSDALAITVKAIKEKFGDILPKMKWINLGGGHHITRHDYNIPLLKKIILDLKKTYNLDVYLEPGEAVALNAGYLVTKILDIVRNSGHNIAILDMSAACHTPDVIEMPYMPPLLNSYPITNDKNTSTNGADSSELSESSAVSDPSVLSVSSPVNCPDPDAFTETMTDLFGDVFGDAINDIFGDDTDFSSSDSASSGSVSNNSASSSTSLVEHIYRLAGPSCLAGDVIGDYAFDHDLNRDELLVFGDMAIYSICKNNTFNGIPLPAIYLLKKDGTIELIKKFSYEDFKERLG
ncbi:MAG: carboxynorspermidine decarboxylase [Lachnospiraceae bacterium]|nr:carboxynorspermidine decarboxylase [Lachnospiraceae bacterium]